MTAEEYYARGNESRKRGDWQGAINDYVEAMGLDPASPAAEAKRMLDDILDFRCRDMYNP